MLDDLICPTMFALWPIKLCIRHFKRLLHERLVLDHDPRRIQLGTLQQLAHPPSASSPLIWVRLWLRQSTLLQLRLIQPPMVFVGQCMVVYYTDCHYRRLRGHSSDQYSGEVVQDRMYDCRRYVVYTDQFEYLGGNLGTVDRYIQK